MQLSGILGQHQIAMLNSSCASSHAARLVERSPDFSPTGLQQRDPTRWANCLTTVLAPIIISQTSLLHPTDSQSVLQTEQHSSGNNETRACHSCALLTALTSAELGWKRVGWQMMTRHEKDDLVLSWQKHLNKSMKKYFFSYIKHVRYLFNNLQDEITFQFQTEVTDGRRKKK